MMDRLSRRLRAYALSEQLKDHGALFRNTWMTSSPANYSSGMMMADWVATIKH
ncbi:hypothetical protein KCP77_01445 [Salmonella enterica subsp. enterica]|nr:hypothetical protein KCP77_01445 [Salmonella enterica subsp. enterica]